MSRLTGSILAVVLVVVVGQEARAQMPGNGAFGMEYAQPIPSNSVVLNRWWMLEATPMVGTMPPPVVVAQPSTAQAAYLGRPARPARAVRSLSRVSSRRPSRAVVTAPTLLPTGSLYWQGASSVPLYTPAQRYATYGYGYGVSPYGTANYGVAFKGMYWGY